MSALRDIDRAIALGDKNPGAFFLRGLIRYEKGDMTAAVTDFDSALALTPKLAIGLAFRGYAKLKLGDKAGYEDIKAARQLDPRLPAADAQP